MLTTSAAFKSAIASEDREIRAYLKFNGSTILRGADGLVSIEWDQSVYDEDRLCIGCAVSSFITAEFFDTLTGVDFKNSYVEAFVGVVLEDTGTAPSGSIEPDTATVEYVSLGRFDITDSVTKNGKTVITAYDKLSKLSGEYTPSISAGANGYAIKDIVNDVLTQSGVGGSVAGDYGYVQKIQASTYREQLKYCLTMMAQNGSSYILDRTNDTLKMTSVIGQDATQLTITDSTTYIDGMGEQPSFTISSLQATTGTDVYTFGSGQGIEISNPYITNAQASAIYNSMEGFSYLPIRLEFRGNPAIDPGDVLTLTAGGKNTKIVAMRIRSTFNGGFKSTIDCYGNTETYYAMSESPTGTRITQAENMIRLEAARATAAEGSLSSLIDINAEGISIVSEKLNNIGGRNLLLNSATKHITAYGGASLTYTDGVAVTEWGAADAIRVTGTTGPSTIFGYLNAVSQIPAAQIVGQPYTYSVWVKNNGANAIQVITNGDAAAAGIEPGESKRVTVTADGISGRDVQINFYCGNTNSALDFVYWHPQIEYGEVVTSWSPAPEDKVGNEEIIAKINLSPETITISANKVNLQGYVTLTNLSTSGQTSINGANLTTGLIQDQAGKNSWNLNTGALTITDGSVNITTSSETENIIQLRYGNYSSFLQPQAVGAALATSSGTSSSAVQANGLRVNGADNTTGFFDRSGISFYDASINDRLILNWSQGLYFKDSAGVKRFQITPYGTITIYASSASSTEYAIGSWSGGTLKLGSSDTAGSWPGYIEMYDSSHNPRITIAAGTGVITSQTGTNKYSALIWPDSNGAGRLVLGDGNSTLWRTSLTNDGLTFRNSSDAVTASYPASIPAAVTPTYVTNSLCNATDVARLRLRKMGTYGWMEFNLRINSTAATADFVTIASFGATGMIEDAFFTLASQENKATLLVRIIATTGDVQVYTQGAAGGFYRSVVPLLLTGA